MHERNYAGLHNLVVDDATAGTLQAIRDRRFSGRNPPKDCPLKLDIDFILRISFKILIYDQ